MLAAAIIVFREILEAALVVGIVAAATKSVPGRTRWLAAGIAAGVLGAVLVALFAGAIANLAEGMGQELFNAAVMLLAVAMLAWHCIWMGRHGREIAAEMRAVGHAVSTGARPLTAVAVVVAVAVLREGSEAVLFLYGLAAGGTGGFATLAGGSALGMVGGILAGAAIYLGLLRISQRYLFAVTTWMIVVLAAGMAASATGFLVEADWLPPVGEAVWNTGWLLPDSSVLGKALHAMAGYTAQPYGIQIIVYAATLAAIGAATFAFGQAPAPRRSSGGTAHVS